MQFKDNPIRIHNPKLGDAFEETVWGLLRVEDMKPVQVRFGVWREGPDGMKFVCKVEYASDRRVPLLPPLRSRSRALHAPPVPPRPRALQANRNRPARRRP